MAQMALNHSQCAGCIYPLQKVQVLEPKKTKEAPLASEDAPNDEVTQRVRTMIQLRMKQRNSKRKRI
jgi:hypothetical protein